MCKKTYILLKMCSIVNKRYKRLIIYKKNTAHLLKKWANGLNT